MNFLHILNRDVNMSNVNNNTITLYHGTRSDVSKIQNEGMKQYTCEQLLTDIKIALEVDTLPMEKVVSILRNNCAKTDRKIVPNDYNPDDYTIDTDTVFTPMGLYFTDVEEQAKRYALKSGGINGIYANGETANLICEEICTDPKYENFRKVYKPNCSKKDRRGEPKIVEIEIPKSFLREHDKICVDMIDEERQKSGEELSYASELICGFKIERDIPKEYIKKIKEIK